MKKNEFLKLTMLRNTWIDMEVSKGWLDIIVFPLFMLMIFCFGIVAYPILIFKKLFANQKNQETNNSQQHRESSQELNTSCNVGNGAKRGAITNGETDSSPAIIAHSSVDTTQT